MRAIPESVADSVKSILHMNVLGGTGENAQFGDDEEWGKTGTTENNGDAWFCGGSTNLTACVWVGHAQTNTPMQTEYGGDPVDGGTFPALIWGRIMAACEEIYAQEAEAASSEDDEDGDSSSSDSSSGDDYVAPSYDSGSSGSSGGGGGGGGGSGQSAPAPAPPAAVAAAPRAAPAASGFRDHQPPPSERRLRPRADDARALVLPPDGEAVYPTAPARAGRRTGSPRRSSARGDRRPS